MGDVKVEDNSFYQKECNNLKESNLNGFNDKLNFFSIDILNLPNQITSQSNGIRILNEKIDLISDYIMRVTTSSRFDDYYMTKEEAIKYLGFSENTWDKYRWKTEPLIPWSGNKSNPRFRKSDLDRFMLLLKIATSN